MDKDFKILELEAKLAIYEDSPFNDAYLGILKQIEACNRDLLNQPSGLMSEEDAKAFERYEKYILKVDEYYEKLTYLRDKMNPKDQEHVDNVKKKKMTKVGEQVAI